MTRSGHRTAAGEPVAPASVRNSNYLVTALLMTRAYLVAKLAGLILSSARPT